MIVRVREATVNGRPLEVWDPRRRVNFPRGKDITLSAEMLNDPNIRRLLPPARLGGVSGGRDGDLVPVQPKSAAKKEA